MLDPCEQWCTHVEVTNACTRKCSNCSRLVAHVRAPYMMAVDDFRRAVEALVDFTKQGPDRQGRRRVIGIMGGEPLLHPQFPELVDILCDRVPVKHRGLWTGLDWPNHKHRDAVVKLLGPQALQLELKGSQSVMHVGDDAVAGYLNWNQHNPPSRHQSALVAIQDVVQDEAEMWRLINQCWLQEQWSGSITPGGMFFCEVAAAMNTVFQGDTGLPVEPGCWARPLADFAEQIRTWCPRCGYCLYDRAAKQLAVPGLQHRLDCETRDDVTCSNLIELERIGSPRLEKGDCVPFEPQGASHETRNPQRYR